VVLINGKIFKQHIIALEFELVVEDNIYIFVRVR